MYSTIEAFPQVQWQAIVNPNTGPGTVDGQSFPTDQNYINAVAQLNNYPNVITLGYIRTFYAGLALQDLQGQVDIYAAWSSYPGANITIHGIFFDDVVSQPSSDQLSYYQQSSAYVHTKFSATVAKVMFNPGTIASTQLFQYCDTMWEFENPLSNYRDTGTISSIPDDSTSRAQSGIMINTFDDDSRVGSIVHNMAAAGIGSVCLSQDLNYKVYDATLLQELAAAVVAG